MQEQNKYEKCTAEELKLEPITDIGKSWALISAQKPDGSINAMTVSWGGIGVLFGKPVAFLFIRPQRYTKEFTDASDIATLSFFPEEYRKALTVCGRVSGRDTDKISLAGLTAHTFDGAVAFSEASTVLVLRKLYTGKLDPENFKDLQILKENYPQEDYHAVYIYEITAGFRKI